MRNLCYFPIQISQSDDHIEKEGLHDNDANKGICHYFVALKIKHLVRNTNTT